jgi:hypothetical protein
MSLAEIKAELKLTPEERRRWRSCKTSLSTIPTHTAQIGAP